MIGRMLILATHASVVDRWSNAGPFGAPLYSNKEAKVAKVKSKPVVASKDKDAPMVVNIQDSRSKQNEAARVAGARKTTRGHRRKERARNEMMGFTRKKKHKGRGGE
jgi:hypothetical protein